MSDLAAGERMDAADYVAEIVREFFRDGSSDVRLVVSDLPRDQWDEIPGEVVHRFPEGVLKVEHVCIGVSVEWIPRADEAPQAELIPIERCAR